MGSLSECRIRKATRDDIDNIAEFIEKYWNPDHILCKSKEFMEWQHCFWGEVCFVIAENKESHELEGIVGYIPYAKGKERDVFGALWKVRNNRYPMLGLKLKLYLMNHIGAKTLSAIGLNPNTLELHRRSGSFLGTLKHYYLLSDQEEYKIAKIVTKIIIPYNREKEQYCMERLQDVERIKGVCDREKRQKKFPEKSFDFICHRYLQHPVYRYQIWEIRNGEDTMGIFVMRKIDCNSVSVLRIVDYIGDTGAIAHTGAELQKLLKGYEYIDFYLYGIEDDILKDAGFVLKPDDDSNIIPNYFEPFVQKNILLDFFSSSGDVVLFRGDGDQDRPNFIGEIRIDDAN